MIGTRIAIAFMLLCGAISFGAMFYQEIWWHALLLLGETYLFIIQAYVEYETIGEEK